MTCRPTGMVGCFYLGMIAREEGYAFPSSRTTLPHSLFAFLLPRASQMILARGMKNNEVLLIMC